MTAIIHVVGNLTREPETREAGSSSVTKLNVAVNYKIRNEEKVTFYSASVWGRSGVAAAQHLTKGQSVVIWGEHRPREYESGGVTRTSEDIENAQWGFAGSKGSGGGGKQQRPPDDDSDALEDLF